MQLIKILQGALLIASQASAAPVTESEGLTLNAANELVKRANPAAVSCGPSTDERAWPLQSVQDSYNALVTNGNLPTPERPAAGSRSYPQQYGKNTPDDASVVAALNAIPGWQTGQANMKYFEFPITDPIFTGGVQGSQGPDRVVAISPSPGQGRTRQYTYCLAMTHRGGTSESDRAFFPCTNAS